MLRSALFLAVIAVCSAFQLSQLKRSVASVAVSSGLLIGFAGPSLADGPVKPTFEKGVPKAEAGPVVISGTITLVEGVHAPESLEKALYITAKPDLGFINSQLLLRKFPAVMSKRIPGEKVNFPLQYTISEKEDGTEDVNLQRTKWVGLPMIVSARYDTDGVAATRDETDLVGKGDSSRNEDDSWQKADIELSDRGVGGKLVTAKK